MKHMTKRILALMIVLAMILSMFPAVFAADEAPTPFTDIKEGSYYYDAVIYVYENGIIDGTTPTTFSPQNKLTRGQLVTILHRAAGSPEVEPTEAFTDVPAGRYFSVPVAWAVENEITNGVNDTTFAPNNNVTREQFATFLFRYAKLAGLDVSQSAELDQFPDLADMHAYAEEAMKWAVGSGILQGLPVDGVDTLSPRAFANRAQAATILMRLLTMPLPINRSELDAAVEKAEALDTSDCTPETVAALEEALATAKEVQANEDATQEEIDAAAKALEDAIAALQGINHNITDIDLAADMHHGAILHTWCWNFNTIRENMQEIAAAGFSALQCPPIAQCAGSRMNINGGWYYHYQPNKYVIGNYQMGTEEEFIAMCEEAHKYGIKVIVDSVINHVTTSTVDESITSIENWRHNNPGSWDQTNRYKLTQFPLSGLPDLNTQNPEIQKMIKDFLVACVNDGADGFRFDAAKLIELPDDEVEGVEPFASDFWPIVLDNGATFQYGESLQESDENTPDEFSSRLGAYQKYMGTTASYYGWMLREQVDKDDLTAATISDWLIPEDASETKIVTWVESHDNYCNDASYRVLDEQEVIQAWAVIAGRRGGTPLFFDRPMNSSASNPWGNDRIGPAGSDMFKDPQVVAVNFMRNELGDAEEALYNPNGDTGVLIIERGDKAAVIINVHDEDVVLEGVEVVNMADGTYPNQAGNGTFVVEDGKLSGTVGAGRVAVAYNREGTSLDFAPAIGISLPSGNFTTESVTVSLNVRGCDTAVYQIDDGEEVPFTDGTVVTLGAELAGDESVTITVTGTKGEETFTATATYTKKIYRMDTIVYIDNIAYNFANPYVYAWANGGSINNAGWPGQKMEPVELKNVAEGVYKYVMPFTLESVDGNILTIFSNSGSNQENSAGHPLKSGESWILTSEKTWEPFTEDYHRHEWSEGVKTADPTCTETGAIEYTCSICETVKTEAIPALGHTWDEGVVSVEPGCVTDGETLYTCSVCEETKTEGIDAVGHNFVDGTCSVCGEADPNVGLYGFVQAAVAPQNEDRVIIAAKTEDGFVAFKPTDYNRNPAVGVAITVDGRVVVDPDESLIWTVGDATYNSFVGLALRSGANNLRFASNRIRLQNNLQYGTYDVVPTAEAFKVRSNQNNQYLGFADGNFVIAAAGQDIYFFTFKAAPDRDTTKLEEAIKAAEELDLTDVTEDSAKALEDALAAANDVLNNPEATQAEIDEATEALEAAIAGLKLVNHNITDIDLAADMHHGTILHTWCWNFNTIRENMQEIAAAGFSALQCPPIAQCAGSRMNINGGWYYHYQPNKYVIGNYQMGTEEEFIAMCEEAHKYGIKVIVDSVINHVTTSTVDSSITSIPNWRHTIPGNWDQTNRYKLTQFALSNLPDLNTQNPEIQQMIKTFLVNCVNDGADGFRFDAAKLIELPDDEVEGVEPFASDFWPIVLDNGATFQYGESLQESDENTPDEFSSRLGAYQKYMGTTASYYGWMLREQVNKDDLTAATISDWLIPEDASETKIVTWVESHDNYCNDASYKELDEQEVIQAWAVIAGRRGGTPLFFDRPMNSSATNPWGNDRIGPVGSDMFKDPQVVAVNFMRNELGDAEEALYNPNGDTGVLIIERGDKAAVIINVHDEEVTLADVEVVNMADGTYPNQAGSGEFVVKDGKLSGTVGAGRVAVAYNREGTSLDFAPAIGISVPTCDFTTESLTVSLNVRGCDTAVYQINDGEEIPFTDGTVITVGADLAGDESVTVTVTGTKGEETFTATATYTKKIYRMDTIVYIDNIAYNFARPYCYAWANGGSINNAGWPGQAMEPVELEYVAEGVYKYVMPFTLESASGNILTIFSNSGSNQENSAGHPLKSGESWILTSEKTWEPFTEDYHRHEWSEGVKTADPTCSEPGAIEYTCSICGKVKTTTIPALGHVWNEGIVLTKPTCTETGIRARVCTVCETPTTETIPALGHAWDEGVATVEPGCVTDGELLYTCTVCSETRTTAVDPVGHDYVDGVCTRCEEADPNVGLYGFVLATTAPKAGDKIIIAYATENGYVGFKPTDYNRNPATGVALTADGRVLVDPDASLVWTVDDATYNSYTGLALRSGSNNLRFASNRIRLQNNLQYGTFAAVPSANGFRLRCNQNNQYLTFSGTAFAIANAPAEVLIFVKVEAPEEPVPEEPAPEEPAPEVPEV